MIRTTMFAAFAALLAASPMALAQTSGTTTTTPHATTESTGANGGSANAIRAQIQPDQVLAGKLKGATVYDSANQKVGEVKDIVLSPAGQVVAVVVDHNDRNVAVAMNKLQITKEPNSNDINKVVVNATQAQLQSAPAVDLNTGVGSSGNGGVSNAAGGGNGNNK